MKKLHLFAFIAVIAGGVVLGGVKLAAAYDIRSGNNVSTNSQHVIHDSLYAAGKTVDINSEVYGDVFCAGQTVTVNGTIHGDVLCAGQTVTVNGTVDGDVRLAGQTVTLGAKVAGNASIGGQTFVTQSNSSIGGDLTVGASDATLNGPIGRDIVGGGTEIIVNGLVGRNIKAGANNLRLGSDARVNGAIALSSRHEISRASGAVVVGKITRTIPTSKQAHSKHGAVFGYGLVWLLYCLLAMLAVAMFLVLLFPRFVHATSNKAMPMPWKALLVGFLACIAAPVVFVLLAITVVGIPLMILLGLAWLVVLILSGPMFAYYLGRLVLRNSTAAPLLMLTGASLLIVLYFIPIIGTIALLAALFIGTGMLLLQLFTATPKPSYSVATTGGKN